MFDGAEDWFGYTDQIKPKETERYQQFLNDNLRLYITAYLRLHKNKTEAVIRLKQLIDDVGKVL